jgi:hypothetical protein
MKELIEKTTSAVARFTHLVSANANRPVTLQVDGDLGSDVIAVKGAGATDTEETTLYDSEGAVLQLAAATPMISFYAPVRLSITKPTTTNAVGLMLLTPANV